MRLQLKRSNVLASGAAKTPTASQLEYGELAINYNTDDPAIFLKDSNNNVIRISGVGNIADDGQVELPATTTPPSNPQSGNLWYNSDDGRLYIYYTDADSSQWVDASPDSWDPTVLPDTTNSSSQSGTLDDRYLMLNSANDPVTGGLNITGGNVGIGTTSPTARLSVNENTATGNVNLADFNASATNANGLIRVITRNAADTGTTSVDFHKVYQSGFSINNNDTASSNFTRFVVGASERMRINSSGNVGIGTNNPDAKLKIQSSNSDVPAQSLAIRQNNAADSAQATFTIEVSPTDGVSRLVSSATSTPQLAFYTANNEAVRIDSSGNVGIGTSTPNNLLDVRGASDPQLKVSATNTGTNSAGLYIENQGQRNWQIWADRSSDQLRIGHNSRASTVVSVTDSRVGIGTTSPTSPLHVVGDIKTEGAFLALPFSGSSEGGEIQIKNPDGTTNGAIIDVSSANTFRIFQLNNNSAMQLGQLSGTGGTITLHTSAQERFRVDSVGNCGIGTSAPITDLTVRGISSGSEGGNLCIQNTGSGINTSVALYLTPNNGGGNDLARTASIRSRQELAGNYANLEFYTAASDTPAERMRIESNGRVCINRTTSQSGGQLSINYTNGFTAGLAVRDTKTTGTGIVLHVVNGSGSIIGGISQNQSSTSFNTSSDYRLKENIVDLDGAIDRVKQLLPKRFNFINDADTTVDGFLAHEAQTVVPEAVTGTHNEVDDDGNPVMQGIDQAKLVPLLTAALQEAITRIEALENA